MNSFLKFCSETTARLTSTSPHRGTSQPSRSLETNHSGAAILVNTCGNSTFTSTGNTIDINQINEACAGILLATTGNSASINLFQNVFETEANSGTCTAPAVASAGSAATGEVNAPRGPRRAIP